MLAHLKGLTNLKILELPHVPLTGKQAAPLRGLQKLEQLHFAMVNADEHLKLVAGLPSKT